ncbi:MAG TPA: bifunctional riboflavin kinase/FAD synthetase [Candidatus Nanopelagicaceae bacterium]|nr:bifunctional riboflavin kinase/FAD synthetase [Candidatus Nanopelagicaceae bacterium]
MGIPFWFGKQPAVEQGAVIAMGVFDGVHLGHRQIIAAAKKKAEELDLSLIALTFDPHPTAVLAPDRQPAMLTTVSYRAELLLDAGADAVVVWPFTKEFASYLPERFVDEILIQALSAKAVFVGENFTYGHKASGSVDQLGRDGVAKGFEVEVIPLLTGGMEPFSSTLIRSAIVSGDLQRAWQLLARPHCVEGLVIHGDARGRQLGYPTANLSLLPHTCIPGDGVYAGWLTVAGERWPAAISVGTNPTFDGIERRVEAYALDREDLALYDQVARVDFGWRLRETLKFASVDDLLVQMAKDCDRARELTR